jgi:hypothetical protein
MPLSWAQRLTRISAIIGTDPITDDEDYQGKALDEYLSHKLTPQNRSKGSFHSHFSLDNLTVCTAEINKLRFTDSDLCFIGKLADGQFGTVIISTML